MKFCLSVLRLVGFATVLILLSNCANPSGKGSSKLISDPSVASTANWTVMVYMAADNNLEGNGITNFLQMQKAAGLTDAKINIIVLFDRASTNDTHIYQIQQSSGSSITSTSLNSNSLGISASGNQKIDMGKASTLSKFIIYCMTYFPANHYCLQMWDHGSGWRSLNKVSTTNISTKAVITSESSSSINKAMGTSTSSTGSSTRALALSESFSDPDGLFSYDVLYTKEMETAIADAYSSTKTMIDMIGFDICYGAMLEEAYGLRSYANYMVASEESTLAAGWDYTAWLEALAAKGSTSAATDAVITAMDAYEATYTQYSGLTLSALNLSQIDTVVSKLKSFSDDVSNSISTADSQTSIRSVLLKTEAFSDWTSGDDINVDIYNMAENLAAYSTSATTLEAAIWTASSTDSSGINYGSSLVYAYWNSSGTSSSGYADHVDARGVAIHLCAIDEITTTKQTTTYPYNVSFTHHGSSTSYYLVYYDDPAYFDNINSYSTIEAEYFKTYLSVSSAVEIPSFISSNNGWVPVVNSSTTYTSNGFSNLTGLVGKAFYNYYSN